ncbi:MAG: hypothetical protein U0694_01960 [Anaerolineae bacterium]
MTTKNLQDFHVEYAEVMRHWSPKSEKYSGGDSLLTALNNGWEVGDIVYVEDHWHTGMRYVPLYHFEMSRNGEKHTMIVIDNPYVSRISNSGDFRVLPLTERRPQDEPKKQKK